MKFLENVSDVLIIGSGPIGLACAVEAKKAGLSHLVLEKGCLVNSIYHYPVNMTFFSSSDRLEIGKIPFSTVNPKPTRAEALEYYRRVAVYFELNIRLFEEAGKIIKTQAGFEVQTKRGAYKSSNLIIATGFYDIPVKMNIPGEDLPKVTHYYRDPHYYSFQNIIIIGASNSSVDSALETWRKGARVTMVIREPDIGEQVKYWVRPDIINRIKEGNIKAYFNSDLTAIRHREADILTPEGNLTIPNDFVLAMTGYQPNFKFLKMAGISCHHQDMIPEHDLETMESNQSGIYMAGVVCGGLNTHVYAIENSREHAHKIINDIKKKTHS